MDSIQGYKQEQKLNKLTFLIATVCGIGKCKFAPGTFGSLAAFPILYVVNQVLLWLVIGNSGVIISVNEVLAILIGHLAFIIILFITGTIYAEKYSKATGRLDPKEVVIDEVVGQALLIFLATPVTMMLVERFNQYVALLLFFIVFRFFDILKPWPINVIDRKVKGGLGIMLDDVAAAIMGSIVIYLIAFVFKP
ncbi:phosphatidylglycerophosphatase A family protein [Rickettsiales endosymbiont of Stachyamoeba lipophora]|uniref:phosphatidylglycerophosphatase A family protein n=1 Tax=Rickettsiales endosymbiont of Stachyamoeba lipophora TaxID=2486578 RepID=UPI000F654E3E|nr:phosphatidylglycerophosphatase A [Rickettsiales endosymbiont of Stachyamoeba lipophora]AZL15670.1 phosphatidylglycerophosphatase A [Rickettsiales endosymbiont of Stachyamoeba lipophora]